MITDVPSQWRNRIVRFGTIRPSEILTNPLNYRTHFVEQLDALRESMDTLGLVNVVVLQDGSNLMIDGHARVELGLEEDDPLAAIWTDLDDDEATDALARLDAIGAMAGTDSGKLAALLDVVRGGSPALDMLRERLTELSNAPTLHHVEFDATAPDEFPEYDGTLATDFACPSCGYSWSGKAKPNE